jgi:hypothetical protein
MNNPPEPYTPEAQSAWLNSLSPDESLIAHWPAGRQQDLIWIALAKRVLLDFGTSHPAEQLRLLECMHKLADPEMVAIIDPAGDTECQIIDAARSLDPPDDKWGRASFDVLTSARVFGHLATLNPSLLAAIKLANSRRKPMEQR